MECWARPTRMRIRDTTRLTTEAPTEMARRMPACSIDYGATSLGVAVHPRATAAPRFGAAPPRSVADRGWARRSVTCAGRAEYHVQGPWRWRVIRGERPQ